MSETRKGNCPDCDRKDVELYGTRRTCARCYLKSLDRRR